ncbi:MAG: serine/threonine protein kinase [Eggerthellaceae bacterium]|nr:serine/threonine protein kinase [Eggerthellaceae bacterium]
MPDELILGRYRRISQAGAGGFATVQLAWDTRIQRRVAIKCLRLDRQSAAVAAGQNSIAVYGNADVPGLEEARTAAMLQDPNIVGVLDFEIRDGTAYLIMEYVDGITLSKLMDEYADQITPDVVAAVFAGVSHALEVAHGNQVLHLDIKPDNVLINHQGQIKVTDFGLSKLSSISGYSKAAGGTIGYMPLEQMRMQPLDARCDEWALASIIYEMIAGENPFNADNLEAAQKAIENAELVLPSVCMPDLDEDVDDVLFYALDPDREERYESVTDFAEELRPLLGSPKRGTAQLAAIVGKAVDDTGDEDEQETLVEMSGFTQKLNEIGGFTGNGSGGGSSHKLSRNLLLRLWSVVNCALLAFVGCAGVSWFSLCPSYVRWIVLLVVCLVALIIPSVGAAMAMIALSLAFISQGAYLCGIAMLIGACAWWVAVGRRGAAQSCTMVSSSTFGSFGCGSVAPLLSGLFCKPVDAVFNAIFSGVLAGGLASLGTLQITGWQAQNVLPTLVKYASGHGGQTLFVPACDQMMVNMVVTQTFWITLACWVIAAVVCSAISGDKGRVRSVMGVLVGGCVLVAGLVLQTYLSTAGAVYVPSQAAILTILTVLVIALAFAFLRR